MDALAVVQHRFEEGVLPEFLSQRNGDRAAADDVARLAGLRLTAPVGAQVADDDGISLVGFSLSTVVEHAQERVGGQRGTALRRRLGGVVVVDEFARAGGPPAVGTLAGRYARQPRGRTS
jgi:hypothetical protein